LFFVNRGIVSDANTVICRMLGRTAEQVVGVPLSSFFTPESRAALETLQVASNGGTEVELIDAVGGRHVVDVLARALAVGTDDVAVIAVRDASERKRSERRIQELAHIDPLTGLANRLLLRDRLAQALAMADRTAGSVAVLCLDLDRFKAVNDTMGHYAGDCLLVEVANRIRAATRETDTVARLGGDEFIVVQPFSGSSASAQALGQRLVQVLAEPYLIDDCSVEISASIGIALHPTDASSGEMLLKQADLALYRAKQEGRGRYCFFELAMDTKLRARHAMEQDLRQALVNQELALDYQPIFGGDRLQLVGYEALLRWRHPTRGAVSPDEFIPLAEECGAMWSIGRWVLETACSEAVSWPEPLSICVNLSPAQFHGGDLPGQVADILARTGLEPDRLELEVTEGILIVDNERALSVLGALKALGVRIALDDFGTGYSSLSYLRRFPFDRLKIDRSFVTELGVDPNADAIVRAITAMSHSLRLEVTAEGVETEQQLTSLRALQCGHLQGYLLGRPAPSGAILHYAAYALGRRLKPADVAHRNAGRLGDGASTPRLRDGLADRRRQSG
jgi:diguanylate cyclase (GGDEF)-like protein/PAS domain S-box-containing protein